MSEPLEMIERRRRILAELSELGLASARDLHQRQLAAETAKDAALLANSLHRISRSLRQTLALEAKLERDRQRADLEDRTEARRDAARRVAQRRQRVEATVERLIWTEYEDAEAGVLVDNLDMLLDEAELTDGFCADPIEVHIARICKDLGLPSPLAGEGVGRGPTDEGSHGDRPIASSAKPDSPAQPLIRPADAGHLLPQREKDDDPVLSDDYWRSSA
jgi:hypothetical protein